ncbi:capsular polysaccharide transport system ATP-binding protein [Sphingobium sp. B11D3B]|nr:capsular polysaccharide transport system ATP-binding protein [Sphingobium sp. B11D3B]
MVILRDLTTDILAGKRLGILGRNGAGKSTLIRLISGAELPTSGYVDRSMSVSWPLAFGGAFQNALTGLDNLRFICRVYNVTVDDKIEYVQEFSELGRYLREPVSTYSAGMRARLAFAISMVVEFDCFLVDEIIAVGDSRFHHKCNIELFEKRSDRAMVFVSHDDGYIREYCHYACVLIDGRLVNFPTVEEALEFYAFSQKVADF